MTVARTGSRHFFCVLLLAIVPACQLADGKLVGESFEDATTASDPNPASATGSDASGSSDQGATIGGTASSESTGTQTESADSGASGSADGAETSSEAGEDSGTTTGMTQQPACLAYPDHPCESAVDCAEWGCGGASIFSEEGCMRSSCATDSDCPSGTVCYVPKVCSDNIFCGDDNGMCSCNVTDACVTRARCVPPNDLPPACAEYPDHRCTEAIDCQFGDCGDLTPFTPEGCLRPTCERDEDCGGGQRCYRAADFGGCVSSSFGCGDDPADGTCSCISSDDCGGAYCVDADDYPDEPCADYPAHGCQDPVDCTRYDCGETEPFSAEGCLRTTCESEADCGACEVCYRASEHGGCAASSFFCENDASGACECGGTDDCGGAYCVPDPDCR